MLHVALKFLSHPDHCITYNEYAASLLDSFVVEFEKCYGRQFMHSNIHNLAHIAAAAGRFGPLEKFSCFKYENHLGDLIRSLRKPSQPLAQFVKRTVEFEKLSIQIEYEKIFPHSGMPHLSGPMLQGFATVQQYRQFFFKSWEFK